MEIDNFHYNQIFDYIGIVKTGEGKSIYESKVDLLFPVLTEVVPHIA
uniref:Uncharacterized protein n=1 Tax=Anguilla anguilla TaxID=7936 RepID=A0A0E9TKN0_ANGAN